MSIVASKGLDQKTKQLLYIAMKAAMGDDMAVKADVPRLKQQVQRGRKWSMPSLYDTDPSGIRGVVHCLPEAVSQFEK